MSVTFTASTNGSSGSSISTEAEQELPLNEGPEPEKGSILPAIKYIISQ